jgi:hypothetical protein
VLVATNDCHPSPTQASLPWLPVTLTELDRAICLLGSRAKTGLRGSARQRLVELLGAYPSKELATEWKRRLKERRNEMAGQCDEATGPSTEQEPPREPPLSLVELIARSNSNQELAATARPVDPKPVQSVDEVRLHQHRPRSVMVRRAKNGFKEEPINFATPGGSDA